MSTIVKNLGNYFQMGEAISANDAIYISSVDGKIYKFSVTDNTQVFAGFAKESGVLDDWTFVSQSGSIKGFTGLTPGSFVYASTTVPGGFQLLDPGSSQKIVFGIARSATELTINGGLGIKPGGDGGGGGLDVYYIENMEGLNDTSDFAVGNNATFLGGGTFQGSLVIDDVAPISGLKSLKYTQAAGSLNDYFASDIIDIDLKQQNNDSGLTLYFEYDGNDNDMRFVVWDVTNNQRLSSESAFVKKTGKAQRYSLSFYVPTNCTQIRWGTQVIAVNSGKVLVVDDVEMSTDPFMEGEITNLTDWRSYTPTVSGLGAGGSTQTAHYRRVGDTLEITGLVTKDGVAGTGSSDVAVSLPPGLVIDPSKIAAVNFNQNIGSAEILRGLLRFEGTTQINNGVSVGFVVESGVDVHQLTGVGVPAGSILSFSAKVPIHGWTSSTPHVLTPTDTFSTDTAPLTYAGSSQYTLSTLANAPVGTFITFTYAINTNTRTQTNAAPPSQSTSNMNVNGIQIFTRAYNAPSTAASPAAIAIQIGKGLKGVANSLYKSAGKVTVGSLEWSNNPSFLTNEYGCLYNGYNENTGVLIVDAGVNVSVNNTDHLFQFSDISSGTNGYLTINASKSSSLTAVPTPLVAYLKDVKPSGTAGGTFTAGAWQTRTLNTLEGDTSFVTLSSNQFSLPPGVYEIEASAPAYKVDRHIIKLRNISTSVDSIIGTTSQSSNADFTQTVSLLRGRLVITSGGVFELQHRGGGTVVTDGFGLASTFSVSEVYSIVKITKRG